MYYCVDIKTISQIMIKNIDNHLHAYMLPNFIVSQTAGDDKQTDKPSLRPISPEMRNSEKRNAD